MTTTTQVAPHHADGSEVMVRAHHWDGERLEQGVVLYTVAATDRAYRLAVRMAPGRLFDGCAPKCVLPMGSWS